MLEGERWQVLVTRRLFHLQMWKKYMALARKVKEHLEEPQLSREPAPVPYDKKPQEKVAKVTLFCYGG